MTLSKYWKPVNYFSNISSSLPDILPFWYCLTPKPKYQIDKMPGTRVAPPVELYECDSTFIWWVIGEREGRKVGHTKQHFNGSNNNSVFSAAVDQWLYVSETVRIMVACFRNIKNNNRTVIRRDLVKKPLQISTFFYIIPLYVFTKA